MEININWFYKIGIGCFSITALCNIANDFIFWSVWNNPTKITNIASLIFNFALVSMFIYILNVQVQGQKAQNIVSGGTSAEEVANAFNEAESAIKGKQ